MKKHRGFTLIEVMIAMAIMGIVSVMAWQGISAMVKAQKFSRERSTQIALMQTMQAQWMNDLDHIGLRVTYVNNLFPLIYDGQSVRIVRYDTMRADRALRIVVWTKRLDDRNADPKTGKGMLLRWQSEPISDIQQLKQAMQNADAWVKSEEGSKLRENEVAIMPIESWEVQSFDNGAWIGNAPIPLRLGNFKLDALRLIITLPPGGLFAGEITRDWIRPTLAGGG